MDALIVLASRAIIRSLGACTLPERVFQVPLWGSCPRAWDGLVFISSILGVGSGSSLGKLKCRGWDGHWSQGGTKVDLGFKKQKAPPFS